MNKNKEALNHSGPLLYMEIASLKPVPSSSITSAIPPAGFTLPAAPLIAPSFKAAFTGLLLRSFHLLLGP